MSDKSAIIKEAQRYLARGQLDKAIAEWEKVAKEYPDGTAFNTIGDLHLKKGNKPGAVDAFHQAASFFRREGFSLKALALYKKILNINSSDSDALLALGELSEAKGLTTDAMKYYLASAENLSKEGKKEKLLSTYEKMVALSPSNVPLRNKVAEIYLKEGLMSEAAKQYLHLARLSNEKDNPEKAVAFYQKSLEAQPLGREAILELTSLFERLGEFDQAIKQMKEAAGLFPQDVEIITRCAETHIAADRFDDAQEYLGQLVEMEPANAKARRLRGELYARRGDREKSWAEYQPVLDHILLEESYDDAIALLESYKDIDPVETGKRLVSLYVQVGENPRAITELGSLGRVLIGKGRQREALNCFQEALKMSPDDLAMKNQVVELEKELSREHVPADAEKTIEEAIVEADIYLKYGLIDNVRSLLESFKEREPENIDLHLRLRSLYVDTDDKKQAISECIILSDLYRREGDVASSEQIMKDAYRIDPDDPRLSEMEPSPEEVTVATQEQGPRLDDYSEELAEADFYSKQGLSDEARAILERLHDLFPENEEINQRLSSLGRIAEGGATSGTMEEPQEPALSEPFMAANEIFESQASEVFESQDVSEPSLDSDVIDIFNEFKKGIEQELEEEDYETHYNLGIAYKEMGLIDDAIREFQSARKDAKRFVNSSSMLGVCYMEKGLYPLAVEVIKDAISHMEDRSEAYWAMKYDMAEAYEKDGKSKEALNLFMEVFGWNSKFRSVSDKIDQLKTSAVESTDQKKTKDRKDRVSYL